MSESKSSRVFVSVASGLILAALLGFAAFAWPAAREGLSAAWMWLRSAAKVCRDHLAGTSGLPNWGLYLLSLISVYALIQLAARRIKPRGPNISEYTQDTHLGLTWRWRFIADHPDSVTAFCPVDDTVLVYSERPYGYGQTRTEFMCETCGQQTVLEGSHEYLAGRVLRQVDRKIRTGEWVNVVPKPRERAA